jgi:PAS domain S-box-containing protein
VTALPLPRARVDDALWAVLISQQELGVAVCDADELLVELNPALEEMLGERYQPAKPEEWGQLYHLYDEDGEPLARDDAPLLQALRGEPVVDRVISTRTAAGSVRHLRCNGAQLHDRRGCAAGAVVFVADVTAAVRQRRQLESLREQLVEVVNHELRTPAAVIKGHAELLDDLREELPGAATTHLDAILRGVERLEGVLYAIRELTDETLNQTT